MVYERGCIRIWIHPLFVPLHNLLFHRNKYHSNLIVTDPC